MTWLAWRQHRTGIAGAAGGLLATALALLSLGYVTAHPAGLDAQSLWGAARLGLLVIPLLPAIFLGAPLLAGDFERGTHRLVWTQQATRRHWLKAKLSIVFAAVLPGAAALATAAQLAIAAVGHGSWSGWGVDPRNPWLYFNQGGLALPAYVVFGVALGVATGALLGRTLPAMVATGAIYTAWRLVVEAAMRPRYLEPLHVRGPLSLGLHTSDWITGMSGTGAATDWTYQPVSRFWLFQASRPAPSRSWPRCCSRSPSISCCAARDDEDDLAGR